MGPLPASLFSSIAIPFNVQGITVCNPCPLPLEYSQVCTEGTAVSPCFKAAGVCEGERAMQLQSGDTHVLPEWSMARGCCKRKSSFFLSQDLYYRPPRPSFVQARACPSTEWALNRCFQDFLGPMFPLVLNAGLGVCDAFVEGKGGPFICDCAFCS